VPIELADASAGRVRFAREPERGLNVHPRASDLKAGDAPLSSGERITPARVALLATLGRREVAVGRRPRVAVVATGSELVDPDQRPGPGQIRDSNRFALAAQVASEEAEPTLLPRAPDDRAAIAAALEAALAADVVLLTGGSSVGDFDFSREVVERRGARLHFDQVAIKPGKPVVLYTLGSKVIFCLPGNPVSSFVTFELLVRPLLARRAGSSAAWPLPEERPTAAALRAPAERDLIQLAAEVATARGGRRDVAPVRSSGSGDLVALARTHLFMHVPRGRAVAAGETVRVLPLTNARDDLPRAAEPVE
jgi:molybdopterin molybdotransferase